MLSDDGLQEIVSIIRDTFAVRKIILFGSYARADAHPHSDLNLCIIVGPGGDQPLEEWPSKSWLYRGAGLSQRASSAEIAVDPHIFTEREFDYLRNREHPLVREILEEGRIVYEQ